MKKNKKIICVCLKPKINNNRKKNLSLKIMTEGNNIRQRKNILFGGNLK